MALLRNSMLESLTTYHDGSKEACHFAILELEKVIRDIAHVPPSEEGQYSADYRKRTDIELGVLLKWQTTVSATFVGLLKKEHTAALIVLAHWVMLVRHLGHKWFLEGWAKMALELIRRKVGEKNLQWMEFPEEYLRAVETSDDELMQTAGVEANTQMLRGDEARAGAEERANEKIFASPTPFP